MSAPARSSGRPAVHLVSLGCARNDVDSEELAARLERGGFRLVKAAEEADAVVVNTCGFVEAAKKDSIDELLAAAELKETASARAVVAVGCLAERYGTELAAALPEADGVLSFDDYADIAGRLDRILAGERPPAHVPRDRRRLLPLTPIQRGSVAGVVPGHATAPDHLDGHAPASGPRAGRRRLTDAPWAPLKLASGCDRRCAFCAIPSFRGAYLSRPPEEVLAEAGWLVDQGVRELFAVSENTTSYGKDLGEIRLLEKLVPQLAALDGLERVRLSYLQPAEMRPGLVEVITETPGVVPYFDLSFQHASGPLLRRMRRFGDAESFLRLIEGIRERDPQAGIRSNVICGFPGETGEDLDMLCEFLVAAGLDAIGVFAYSDEDGTEAARLDGHLEAPEVERRRNVVADLADELVSQRAEARIGSRVQVLVEEVTEQVSGRCEHQGPEVDGLTTVVGCGTVVVGDVVEAVVVDSDGVDLMATAVGGVGHG